MRNSRSRLIFLSRAHSSKFQGLYFSRYGYYNNAMLKLTEELIAGMSEKVADGIPVCYVCDFFEIHETTYEAWMKRGNDDAVAEVDSLYAKLYRSIKKSYAQHIMTATARIKSGVQGWQGTAWLLERTNNKYMPKQQIQADDEGKVNVIIGGKEKQVKKA